MKDWREYSKTTEISRIISEIKAGKRSVAYIEKSDDLLKKVENMDLDIIDVKNFGPNMCAVGIKKKVEELHFEELFVYFQTYKKQLDAIYEKVKNYSGVEAVRYIIDDCPRGKNSLEKPEEAIMLGLLFGYPLCDITYYLETRFEGKPMHDKEYAGQLIQRVLCENHAQKILEETGFTAEDFK